MANIQGVHYPTVKLHKIAASLPRGYPDYYYNGAHLEESRFRSLVNIRPPHDTVLITLHAHACDQVVAPPGDSLAS